MPPHLGEEPAALLGGNPLVIPGEKISWQVTFAGIEGGRARMAVGTPGDVDGRRTVLVRAEAETSGLARVVKSVHDSVQSWADLESGMPSRTESDSNLDGKSQVVHAVRGSDPTSADLTIWRNAAKTSSHRVQRLPAGGTHDPMTALMLVRAWEAADGARGTFHTLGGLRLWRTELLVEGREEIDTRLGRRRAIRIVGVSTRLTVTLHDDKRKKPRTFTVWLSDDASRIPLMVAAKTEYGDVTARVWSYEVSAE